MQPVCLVIGAGAGIGGNVGKRFAREGFHVCLCRRSDEDGLQRLVERNTSRRRQCFGLHPKRSRRRHY